MCRSAEHIQPRKASADIMPSHFNKSLIPFVACVFLYFGNSMARDACGESFCRFRLGSRFLQRGTSWLHPENPFRSLGIPNTALGPIPLLQRKGGRIVLMSNVTGGEALVSPVFSEDNFVKISNFKRSEADPNFRRDQIKWIVNKDNRLPSIGRLKFRGNQETLLNGLCVRLPIRSFDLLRADGSVKKRVAPKGKKTCVAFRTTVPTLLVDLQWNATDDFDLRLREPNGFEINRFGSNKRSPNGVRLTKEDSGTFLCRIDLGIERVQYFKDVGTVVEGGEYTVTVVHLRSCERNSRYILRVLYKGDVILDRRDVLNGEEEVIVEKFSIP